MDPTLKALVTELFRLSIEIDRLREQNAALQVAYTDLKERPPLDHRDSESSD